MSTMKSILFSAISTALLCFQIGCGAGASGDLTLNEMSEALEYTTTFDFSSPPGIDYMEVTNLIDNESFESSNSILSFPPWVGIKNHYTKKPRLSTQYAYRGEQSLSLSHHYYCGYDIAAYQEVTVPSYAVYAILTFRTRFQSPFYSWQIGRERTLQVTLGGIGAGWKSKYVHSEDVADDKWLKYSMDASQFLGKTIKVEVRASGLACLPIYMDDVRLNIGHY